MAIKSFFSTIWHNRRHFKMQIFGIMVLCTIMIFIINLISIKVSYNSQVKKYLSSTSKYTNTFQMSLSGVTGKVDKVYVDSTKTKCFILVTMRDTSALTMSANNYQLFVTNCDRNGRGVGTPEELLTGEIYMFGSEGIVGFYIKSDIPFENTMKSLVLRSYSKFTGNTQPYVYTTSSDAEYDQCHIYFNPGATDTQSIAFLENHQDGTRFDLTEIYRQVNSVIDEYTIRQNINQFYADLLADMNKIMEYQTRLSDIYNVEVPKLPDFIYGDYFDDVLVYDSAGTQIGSYNKYIPATIVPGGTEYDWYSGNIVKGGYYRLVPNTQDIKLREYLQALNNDRNNRELPSVKSKEWFYKDGTQVNMKNKNQMTSLELETFNTITAYETLLEDYMSLKKKYQATYLRELLELELNSDFSSYTYTVRDDENALLCY